MRQIFKEVYLMMHLIKKPNFIDIAQYTQEASIDAKLYYR
jgi:hypothetical protein